MQGDFTVTGNTLNECCFSPTDEDANPGSNPPAAAADTNSSSRASFSVPTGATVTKAFLYTFVDFASTTDWPATMKVAAPGGDYQDVTMTDLGSDQQGRVIYSDVTSVLGGGGDGEVWVGSPNSFAAAGSLHAWGLYVVYSHPSLPWRQVVLVDQAAMIGAGATTTNATIPDLAVAPGGAADVTLAAFEFYSSSGGGQEDTLQICAGSVECADAPGSYSNPSVYAQNSLNPAQDIANGTFSLNGNPMPGTAPSPTFLWSDLDLFEMPGALPSGTTSATVTARSVSDTIFSGFVALSTTVFAPIAQLSDTVSGVPAPGGVLDVELNYDLDNAGDNAEDVVITDSLPSNVTYVPGSAQISSGANSGPKTDASGDDQVEISGSNLTWRVGSGASSSAGGDVATSDGPQVLRFRVQVAGGATPGDVITNLSSAAFHGERTPSLGYVVPASSTTTVVAIPSPPAPSALTSSAAGPSSQSATTSVPVGGTAMLLDGGSPVTNLTVTGGVYSVDPSTGVITFTPAAGYSGSPTPAAFRVTDSFAQSGDSTYSPTVTLPAAPNPTALTSSGTGTATQSVTATVPTGATITLLDGSTPVTTLTVSGQGTYTLDPATGIITFAPALGHTGAATAVAYRITDGYSQSGSSTYTPTVTTPAAPSAPAPLTSTAVGTAPQTVNVTVPSGGTLELLDGSTPVTTLAVAGEGTYAVNNSTGTITFTPELGFDGVASPVTFRVTDAYAQSASATYTPTVTTPPAPLALALTSTGTGTDTHRVTLVVPPGGSVTLLDGATPVTTLTVSGQGTYTLDPATGAITFTPELGFVGTAAPLNYSITDAYAQTSTSTYTPAVAVPAPPAAGESASSGRLGTPQSIKVSVPTGGTITLLDGTTPVSELTIAGQGTYVLDAATGTITFTPVDGFIGTPTPVTYLVTDAYGQSTTGTYAPQVLGAEQVASPVEPTTADTAGAGAAAPDERAPARLAFTGSSATSPIVLGALLLALGTLAIAAKRLRLRKVA